MTKYVFSRKHFSFVGKYFGHLFVSSNLVTKHVSSHKIHILGDETTSSCKDLYLERKIFCHQFVSNNLSDETSFLTQIVFFCENFFCHLLDLINLVTKHVFSCKINTLDDKNKFSHAKTWLL